MIVIKSPREIEQIRKSCQLVVDTFRLAEKMMEPGVATLDIDREVDKFIRSRGARPAF